jgi:acylglycerol lipase
MVNRSSKAFVNGRGQRLHTVQYIPAEPAKALLIFHHGYGEHTGRYDYGELKH